MWDQGVEGGAPICATQTRAVPARHIPAALLHCRCREILGSAASVNVRAEPMPLAPWANETPTGRTPLRRSSAQSGMCDGSVSEWLKCNRFTEMEGAHLLGRTLDLFDELAHEAAALCAPRQLSLPPPRLLAVVPVWVLLRMPDREFQLIVLRCTLSTWSCSGAGVTGGIGEAMRRWLCWLS